MADRFPRPFEIATLPGAEGRQQLYRYSSQFSHPYVAVSVQHPAREGSAGRRAIRGRRVSAA